MTSLERAYLDDYFPADDDGAMQVENAPSRPDARTIEKDSDEEALERLVFGDNAGFRAQLLKGDAFLDTGSAADGALELVDGGPDTGAAHIDDADLFVLDDRGQALPGEDAASWTVATTTSKPAQDPVAWVDSDDERLTVSLATVSRLRKLRVAEGEDIINGTEYCSRLRQHYLSLSPTPAWAREALKRKEKPQRARRDSTSGSDEDDADGDLSTQPLASFLRNINQMNGRPSKKRRLRPEILDIQRSRDIPIKHKAPVSNLSFHPEHPILLSSSAASLLYLHRIDPEAHPTPNPEIISVQAEQIDVRRAEFLGPVGNKVFFAGRRRFLHSWNLETGLVQKTSQVLGHKLEHKSMEHFRLSPCGRWLAVRASSRKGGGSINILNVTTMQWAAAARLDSRHGIADYCWWRSGDGLTILGQDGRVGEWSLEDRRFLGIWQDDGSIGGTRLSLGGKQGPAALGGDRWVAVGSNSGIVNVYDRQLLLSAEDESEEEITIRERPTPSRVFEQLVTPVTSVQFSPDGQILAFASQAKADALRLAHIPSCTVYRNWPTQQTPLGRITAVAFGSRSDVLAVGNDQGKIRLWEIRG